MILFETEADPAEWFLMPLHWGTGREQKVNSWSQECADIMSRRHRKWWQHPNRNALGERFKMLAESHPDPRVPAHQVFLYGGDPRRVPQPFYALTVTSEGEADREKTLAMLVHAVEEDPIRPPDVEDFVSEHLGEGVRCLRYFGSDEELGVSLNYGWWIEELQIYATLRTVTGELGWLSAHIDVFDDFVRSIWINSDPH